jgi:hydroxyacylglutathione hydrolase
MNDPSAIIAYTGGMAETNSYAYHSGGKAIVIDAPEGTLDWLKKEKVPVDLLFLTHGHWDHIWDAAAIARHFGCRVVGHEDDALLFKKPDIMRQFGLPVSLEPVPIDAFLEEGKEFNWQDRTYQILHIPGHCPGSICLVDDDEHLVFGGDVLFAGAIGRWDLPGGSRDQLLEGLARKMMVLPDDYALYPGHGPVTSIGRERQTNPFCIEAAQLE